MSGFKRRGFLSMTGMLGMSGIARAAVTEGPPAQTLQGPHPVDKNLSAHQVAVNARIAEQAGFVTSFDTTIMHKADGGWARELNRGVFPALQDISVVNMLLEPNGMREMFWREQAEWGFVKSGVCRVMSLDEQGRSSVDDVAAGDIWSLPAGTPHSIIGLAPTGAEVLMFLDNAAASEFETHSVSQWVAATPPEILAKNFAASPRLFKLDQNVSQWISRLPGAGDLEVARKSARMRPGAEKLVYLFSRSNFYARAAGGFMQVVDSGSFPASKPFSASSDIIHVGGMREMHWHPHAAEFGVVLSGAVELSVMEASGHQSVSHLKVDDVWTIPQGRGHYLVNRGTQDAHVLMVYKADQYAEYSLSDWLTHVPHKVSAASLGVQESDIDQFPTARRGFVPR